MLKTQLIGLLIQRISDTYSDVVHFFLYRFHPEHKYHIVDTGLKPGYYDDHARLLNTVFNLNEQFLAGLRHEADASTRPNVKAGLYWQITRPALLKQIEEVRSAIPEEGIQFISIDNDIRGCHQVTVNVTEEAQMILEQLERLEKELVQQDKRFMKMIVGNYEKMWN